MTARMRKIDETAGMVSQLRDMHRRLRDGRHLTETQNQILADGIAHYLEALDSGREASIDRAFGLKARGGVSPARQDALSQRDELIRQLWQIVPAWRDLDPYAASGVMSLDAARYEALRGRRTREEPPVEPARTWWLILQLGVKIPGKRRIHQLLESQHSQRVHCEIQRGV
ncbi:hypothetical protein GFL95_14260 [Rhizobium leguminosarum bv. viciae]|uniref:hypothetical protein n=1 Tax=Rhizobium leguminosarum TaxID=384 RepID=UPI0014424FB6|nr:hypothetical protein [Rhizobium leguminosarum]NKK92379.1 hypothetical protein [Rhizobium leguminosarum bv. viciae]